MPTKRDLEKKVAEMQRLVGQTMTEVRHPVILCDRCT